MKNFVLVVMMVVFVGIVVFGGNLIYTGLELPIPTGESARTPIWLGALFMAAGSIAVAITGGYAIENCN